MYGQRILQMSVIILCHVHSEAKVWYLPSPPAGILFVSVSLPERETSRSLQDARQSAAVQTRSSRTQNHSGAQLQRDTHR